MRDLKFVSGTFFETEIPKDKAYLRKYFKTELQLAFLRYYLEFGDTLCFVDHTGHWTTHNNLSKMERRLKRLMEMYRLAKSEMNFDLVYRIEVGKFRE